jgi:hypothetical protein
MSRFATIALAAAIALAALPARRASTQSPGQAAPAGAQARAVVMTAAEGS